MQKYKTSQKNRSNYRYYFVDGKIKEICPNDHINSENIRELHFWDDTFVDDERKENYHVPIHYADISSLDKEVASLVDSANPLFLLIQSEEEQEKRELLETLNKALGTLTLKQQETIRKVFYEHKSNTEIGREEGVSEAAIRHRLKN